MEGTTEEQQRRLNELEKKATEGKQELTEYGKKIIHGLQADTENLHDQLKTAKDRVEMLEIGLELKTTRIELHRTENPDSMEIGAQATGRVKIYMDCSKKAEAAEKVKNAFEILVGARERLEKLNGAN